MKRVRIAQCAAVGLVMIALAACTPTTAPSSSPTSTPAASTPAASTPAASASSPAASPSASSSPSPTADPSDPASWLITTAGVGPVRLGTAVASVPQVAGWSIRDSCRWAAFWGDAALQLTAAGDAQETAPAVAEISVVGSTTGPQPHTESGIRLGSSEDQVRSAYPGAVDGTGTYGPWIRTGDPAQGAIYFTLFADTRTVRQVTVSTRPQPSAEFCG